MKTKHTPGNWEVKDCHDDTRTAEIKTDGKNIATVWAYNNGSKIIDFNEQQANAKLMGASPRLLNALQLLINFCGIIPKEVFTSTGQKDFQTILNNAAEAINQATV